MSFRSNMHKYEDLERDAEGRIKETCAPAVRVWVSLYAVNPVLAQVYNVVTPVLAYPVVDEANT